MKTIKFIILSTISILLVSCFSANYKVVTHINRNGSGWREIQTTVSKSDSITDLFPYNLSNGWKILQMDSADKKNVKISKNFNSIENLSTDLRSDKIFPVAKESLQKHFRWFYTYYDFKAIYSEIKEKGDVSLDKYLNKTEQKFYLQGDMSAYKGMNGIELQNVLDDIERRFMKWYQRSIYEENFDVILYFSDVDFQSKLTAVKDTLYSIYDLEKQENIDFKDVCAALDKYFSTDIFTKLLNQKEKEMHNMLDERQKTVEALLNYNIQYQIALPGKILSSNTDLTKDGVLKWNVNLYRFLADDYTLTAKSRTTNYWAFAVTLLLILFSLYALIRKK